MAVPNPSILLLTLLLSSHPLAQAFSQSTLTRFPQQAGFGSIQPSNPNSLPLGPGSTQLPGSVDQTAPTEPSTVEPNNDGQSQGGFQQGYPQQNPNAQSSATSSAFNQLPFANAQSSTSSSTFNQLPFARNTRQGLANANNYPFSNSANAVGAFALMHFPVVIAVIVAF